MDEFDYFKPLPLDLFDDDPEEDFDDQRDIFADASWMRRENLTDDYFDFT